MNSFTLHGRVVEQNTGLPLSQLLVKAFSNAKFPGKLPAPVQTNYNGEFSFCITVKSLRELFERKPDIFFSLSKPGITKPFYTSETAWNWRTEGRMLIEVPAEKFAPSRNVRLQLVNEAGEPTESFVPGENLYINATGLRPAHNYKILVQEEKETLFKPEVITDRMGNLNMVPFWPQAGLSDVSGDRMFTVKEALQIWQNRKLSLSLSDGRRRFNSVSFNLAGKPVAPLVFHSDGQGRVLNGFVNDKKTPIILAVHFYRANSEARVYIVPARQNWQHGDAFVPVASGPKGRPAVFEVSLRRSEQMQLVALGSSSQLPPGAYDFIVRPLRYGSEDQRRHTIQPGDILVGNRVTGLVLREEFMHGKLVQGGCVNKLDLSGRGINGQPYFQYADTFEKGEDVYFALDPNIVDPANAGKMCAIYVVPNKSEAEWNSPGGNGLNHLPILGGNAAVQKLLVQTGCVNANKRLVWPAAGIPGEYDMVADFGNNTTNAASFLTDNEYNAPLDIIDGYFSTGFRVVDDPATITQFNFFGQFDYTQPTVTVQDEGNFFALDSEKLLMNTTAAMLGRVAFPADMAGATTAAQVSATQPDYPMIFIVHGFGHHYDDYDYLLQHFALNGFIAVAFEIPYINGLGRANLLFHHINYIKNEFGAKAQNNIGIMGHSRGGEAVVKAARLNQQQALGHNINAVISLAPTDQYGNEVLGGAWSKPYLVLHGALDGDVRIFVPLISGGAITPFTHRSGGPSLYDRANGSPKTMVWIYGASHNGFIGYHEGLQGDPVSSTISFDAHRAIARGYMNGFFRKHLLGEAQWDGIFTGDWQPQAVKQADGGAVKLYIQYSAGSQFTIDHFEGAHTSTSWQSSTVGGMVSQTGLPNNPQEAYLHDADSHSAHDTSGLLLSWNSSGDKLEFNVPAIFKNVTAWKVLSFRVCQRALDAANPANQPVNFRVALRDGSGNERAIRVSAFAEIPYPQQRVNTDNIVSLFRTVRIPLTAYTIVCLGVPKVNLADITRITFLFSEQATGSIELDDLCFTV